jgi:hypothetical protein
MTTKITPQDWKTAIVTGNMPLQADVSDMIDLNSELVYNYTEKWGVGQIIFRNGWFYYGSLTETTWARCNPIDKLDPVYFH